jgi:STAM-binding protein
MTLGWIHTHPTQTCFMSSVDLHTQFSYQYFETKLRMLMPEAVSIVCAPSKTQSLGVFRLTDPPGIDIVSECNHPDMFHLHERNDEIYEEVSVAFDNGTAILIDLR